jgi:hypothetical protein
MKNRIQNSDKTPRIAGICAILLLTVTSAFAQTTVMPYPNQQWLDINGNPISGALLYTCIAGNSCSQTNPPSNAQATYTDEGGMTPNANPVVANSAGRMNVWLTPGLSYKFVLATSANVLVWSVDNVLAPTMSTISTCAANYVVAGPTTGAAAAPTCRALVAADIPDVSGTYASVTLNNLGTTNINASLLAQAGVDVGSASKPVRNIFLYGAGTYSTTSLKLTGTPTAARVWTFQDTTDTVVGRATTDTLTNKTLTAPVIATIVNSGTLTLPTSTDTMVARATTDTLTNKTLTNPIINGPAPIACGGSCSIATTAAGTVTLLNLSTGSAATLPASTGSGNIYKFRITTTTASNTDKILLTTVSDVIIGLAIGENAGTPLMFSGTGGTYHSIQMPFAGSQPSGGFAGDSVTCTDIAAGKYACDVLFQAGTSATTPYSSSTT